MSSSIFSGSVTMHSCFSSAAGVSDASASFGIGYSRKSRTPLPLPHHTSHLFTRTGYSWTAPCHREGRLSAPHSPPALSSFLPRWGRWDGVGGGDARTSYPTMLARCQRRREFQQSANTEIARRSENAELPQEQKHAEAAYGKSDMTGAALFLGSRMGE